MGTSGSDDIHQDPISVEHETIITQRNGADDDDDKSHQKKRRRQPKLVVEKPVGLLEDGHGIATDLDEQPVTISIDSCEGTRQLSVSKGHSSFLPPDHRDKSLNQANITTSGANTDYQQEWPFVKQSSRWATLEALELFKTLPQKPKPHFSPLKEYEECLREDLAISDMITFLRIVQMLPYLKLNGPVDEFHKSLKRLAELETHGFDVGSIRDRLNEMLSLKSKAGQHKDELRVVEEEIEECNHVRSLVDEEMNLLKVKMQELQEKMAKGAAIQKRKEEESMRLQSKLHLVSNKINDQERAFEKLGATPL